MTVQSTTARNEYLGDGLTSVFPVTFQFLQDSHLGVYTRDTLAVETKLVLAIDYTVTGAGNPTGGEITLVAGNLPANYIIVIIREVPFDQQTDYVENDNFPADSHETALDKLTMISQQLQEEVDRALVSPVTGPVPPVLPGGNTYYVSPVESDHGAPGSGASLKDIIDLITPGQISRIVFQHSLNNQITLYNFLTSISVPDYVYLQFEPGAVMLPQTGITITIDSPFHVIAQINQQIAVMTNNSINPVIFNKGGVVSPNLFEENTSPGTTLMQDAVQAAFTSINPVGGACVFLAGTYLTNDNIVPSPNTLILGQGHGSILKWSVSARDPFGGTEIDGFLITNQKNISVKNIQIDGGATNWSVTNNQDGARYVFNVTPNGVRSVENLSFENVFFKAGGQSAVKIIRSGSNTVRDVRIMNCRFQDFGNHAFVSEMTENIEIVGNTFLDVGRNPWFSAGGYGNGMAADISHGCIKAVVSGNTIDGATNGAIKAQSDATDDAYDVIISDNVIKNIAATGAGANYSSAIRADGIRILVTGNEIFNCEVGIQASGQFGSDITINNNYIDTVVNNINPQRAIGIFVNGVFGALNRVSVNNNHIYNSNHQGIIVEYCGAGVQVNGNYIDTDGPAGNYGIRVSDSNDVSVKGNTILNFDNTGAISIEVVNAATDSVTLKGNMIRKCGPTPIWIEPLCTNVTIDRAVGLFGSASAGTNDERPVFVAEENGAYIWKVSVVNASSILQNDSNYSTYDVQKKGSDGTGIISLISVPPNTRLTGGLNINAFDPISLNVDQNEELAGNEALTLIKTDSGSGQPSDVMQVIIDYVPF